MSKPHRAALEEVQSRLSRAKAELRVLESRIADAAGFAVRAEADLATVQVPLNALREKNRALEQQIRWENGEWQISDWRVAVLLFLVAAVAVYAGSR